MDHFSFRCGDRLLCFGVKDDRIRLLGISKEEDYDESFFETGRFIEIQISGYDQKSHHGLKNESTYFGLNSKFVRKEIRKFGDRTELVIHTKTDEIGAKTHFIHHEGTSGFSIYNEIKNISEKDLSIEFVSSAYIPNLFGVKSGENPKDIFFHSASNSWHCEAQWRRRSFLDLGLFNGNGITSFKKIELNNTGSWSTKEHLPMCVLEKDDEFILAQIESCCSWHIEVADSSNRYYLSASGPTFFNNNWSVSLKPNDAFVGVQASISFGDSFEKAIQEITKIRRFLRRKFMDNEELPVIFNDYMHALWDTQTEDTIIPLVDIAKEVGCEEFCIDAGWFAKGSDWWSKVGDWEECKDNFPTMGLKGVIDYIHSKGMKAGIWYEIEALGIDSKTHQTINKKLLFNVNGEPVYQNSRYRLDFSNPEIYEWAKNKVGSTIKEYGLDYIKMDNNTDIGPGTEINSHSLGDGLLKHGRAYLKWVDDITDSFPNLTFENCASGGCRMDYETLKHCPIQSTSDQTDFRKYPYLSSAVLTACPPEQAAVWSYPVDSSRDIASISDEDVAANMCNAMLGRIHLASHINKLDDKKIGLVKEGVAFYKETRPWKNKSLPIYPNGISYFYDETVVGGLIDEKHLMLGVWNASDKAQAIEIDLSKYGVKYIEVGYPKSLSTDYHFENGILKIKLDKPHSARIFVSIL